MSQGSSYIDEKILNTTKAMSRTSFINQPRSLIIETKLKEKKKKNNAESLLLKGKKRPLPKIKSCPNFQ